jgi:hypothetical protein
VLQGYQLDTLLNAIRQYSNIVHLNREGEERIRVPTGNKVELNDNFLKIRILPTFKKDFKGYDFITTFTTKKDLITLLKRIQKHHDVFDKNETYYRFIRYLRGAIQAATSYEKLLDYVGVTDKEDRKEAIFSYNLKGKD